MKREIPVPLAIGVIAAVVIVGIGYGLLSSSGNGESPNPNAGKPSKSTFRAMTRQAGDSMDEKAYLVFLKQNRPDLNDAQLQAMADRWWRIKSGTAGK